MIPKMSYGLILPNLWKNKYLLQNVTKFYLVACLQIRLSKTNLICQIFFHKLKKWTVPYTIFLPFHLSILFNKNTEKPISDDRYSRYFMISNIVDLYLYHLI